jgi:hypothetical protein
MDLTDAPPPAAETATTDGNPSLDQLIAEAEAANPGVPAETPPAETETPPAEEAKPEAEEKPPAEEPKVEEKAKEEGISERSARQILDAAHRKHKQAETHTATFIADFKRELRVDPSGALEKVTGYTLDQLIDIQTGVAAPAERTEAKPADDAKQAELDRRLAAIEEREAQAVVTAKVAEIKSAVTADVKTFPTINARGKHDVVIDFMTEYYNTHGSPIAWREAAKLVEAELKELAGGAAEAPAVPAAKPVASTPVVPPKPTTALTNGDVRTTAPVDEEPTDPDELIKYLTRQEEARLSRRAS